MRQTMARGSGFAAALRRRWWIFPIVLLLVAAGLVLRALTAPLAVNASVTDGDHAVVRSSAVVLAFNQDMDVASVENGFRITPLSPFTVVVKNPRTFEFRPWLQPDTSYRVRVIGARKSIGFGSQDYAVAFHTEPAPKVAGVKTASDASGLDDLEYVVIVADLVDAQALAHIGVEIDRNRHRPSLVCDVRVTSREKYCFSSLGTEARPREGILWYYV